MKPDFLHKESMERKSGYDITPLNYAGKSSPLKGSILTKERNNMLV